ncbi:MAG: hypothetical protein PHP57_13240 [Sideroxydans sp.]|nr:hypothetical protein [Sideroxydans sp.]
MKTTHSENVGVSTPFLGLAPYLRASIAGVDLRPLGQEMLAQAELNPADAALWMNLSVAMQCVGQHDIGVTIQSLALEQQRVYQLAAATQAAKLRVLLLLVAGDIAANTPIDCLLENSDIDLIFYYVTPNAPLAQPIPEHDVLMLCMSEVDENHDTLIALEKALAHWPKPIINAPQHIASTGRNTASTLLQDIAGLAIPPTLRTTRSTLTAIASNVTTLGQSFSDCDFPLIVRPVGSQAGRDLARIATPDELSNYLVHVNAPDFFIARFIDYSGTDGQFRKYRIALIDGQPYACHMAVSNHWMVHYVNAGMYEEAKKRAEELAFFENFDDFAIKHASALNAIYQRTQMDYLCLDCAETPDGELLIFEIDHTMVVHAMDPESLFPYKQTHMRKVQNAFRDYLIRLSTHT